MNIADQISRYIRKTFKSEKVAIANECPNCWGREEYNGKYYEAVVNQTPTLKTGKRNVGWIQDYVAQYLSNARKTSKGECPRCRVAYQQADLA